MTLAEQIELACMLEATAPKLGNVHPGASFHDATYQDFVTAARLVATPLSRAGEIGVGAAIFEAVRQTREAVGTNVNLGIVLLLAPLAAVPVDEPIEPGLGRVLARTTISDAESVYAAIRLAKPGGLGDASTQDVQSAPTVTLTEAMALAADRDMIAEQYATGFDYVRNDCQQILTQGLKRAAEEKLAGRAATLAAVTLLQREILSRRVDTLIARKLGLAAAEEVRVRFRECYAGARRPLLRANQPLPSDLQLLDDWLRADGHRRNPGATADLIAAALFVAIRSGLVRAA